MRQPGKILHVFMGGTVPGEANTGIAREMAEFQCELGRQKGFLLGYGNVTGNASVRFFTKYVGFQEIGRVSYKEWTYEGIIPFEKCRPEFATHYVSIVKDLNPTSRL